MVDSGVEVVDVPFVHGHARDTGWVMAHRRPPTEAEEGQLPLPDVDEVPAEPPDAADDRNTTVSPG